MQTQEKDSGFSNKITSALIKRISKIRLLYGIPRHIIEVLREEDCERKQEAITQYSERVLKSVDRVVQALTERNSFDETTNEAITLCERIQSAIAIYLGTTPASINCTLKIIANVGDGKKRVVTWARADTTERSTGDLDEGPQFVENNTFWAVLTGKKDNKGNDWKDPYPCFSCGNLMKHKEKFSCYQENWFDLYQSAVVFSLKLSECRPSKEGHPVIGFLSIDSRETTLFKDLPDIFKYKNNRSNYMAKLKKNSFYQFGSMIAYTLALSMHPIIVEREKEIGNSMTLSPVKKVRRPGGGPLKPPKEDME